MADYPTELMPTVAGVLSYSTAPEDAAAAYDDARLRGSPVDKIVGAFDALKGHAEALDAEGLAVLASCAQQITLNGFHGRSAEALAVRDQAISLMG